jgi:hypothetical protein
MGMSRQTRKREALEKGLVTVPRPPKVEMKVGPVSGGLSGVAHHEAGHVVLMEMFSIPVEYLTTVSVKSNATLTGNNSTVLSEGGSLAHFKLQVPVRLGRHFTHFLYGAGFLASIAVERKLGIPFDLMAFVGDVDVVERDLARHFGPDKRFVLMKRLLGIAVCLVNHADVWAAISEVAEAALLRKTIYGDEIRLIVSKHVPPDMFISDVQQAELEKSDSTFEDWSSRRFDGKLFEDQKLESQLQSVLLFVRHRSKKNH